MPCRAPRVTVRWTRRPTEEAVAPPSAVSAGSAAYEAPVPGPVVTVGNFDGVHLGHRALLAAARDLAGPDGTVLAYTFHPSPRDVMQPGHGVPLVQSIDDRVATLLGAGADHVVVEAFDRAYADHSAAWFVEDVLVARLHATGVVVGWDFRFGKGRAGDEGLLRALLDVPVRVVDGVTLDGAVVSSTRVRQAVQDGDLGHAARMLARPHEVVGPVVRGDARGRRIGFPTANVAPVTELLPPAGVYAVRVDVDGTWVSGVANLGDRPTFGPGRGRLEVHLLDFDGDLYDRVLRVRLVARLRGERAFDGVDALVAQIRRDADAARAVLAEAS
ncbi:MAG: riboflavin biosynthesis protein RibF [Alphaproteobacteria bacterium]|nr:riboflavin biosynthesis protein RibF [Alphaproteobacteria bacterium]